MASAEASLILRCKENDEAAFNEIVERHKVKLYTYILRMVGNSQDAEDLAQEAFVRAYLSIKSFEGRASLTTWLFRIATNLCIDRARRSSTRQVIQTTSLDDVDENGTPYTGDLPDGRYEPQDRVLQDELKTELEAAISRLPEKLRMVILLHDLEGLQYDEIAEVLHCPLGTVKSRIFSARQALREQLSNYLYGSV
ncbi:MAG: sigma-70 family RNA polymerase sigma factor [Armatimonadetes bacterium]|nr:sigma-70 family RNA polymerase sigma factor [Armatimonadota bacterium]